MDLNLAELIEPHVSAAVGIDLDGGGGGGGGDGGGADAGLEKGELEELATAENIAASSDWFTQPLTQADTRDAELRLLADEARVPAPQGLVTITTVSLQPQNAPKRYAVLMGEHHQVGDATTSEGMQLFRDFWRPIHIMLVMLQLVEGRCVDMFLETAPSHALMASLGSPEHYRPRLVQVGGRSAQVTRDELSALLVLAGMFTIEDRLVDFQRGATQMLTQYPDAPANAPALAAGAVDFHCKSLFAAILKLRMESKAPIPDLTRVHAWDTRFGCEMGTTSDFLFESTDSLDTLRLQHPSRTQFAALLGVFDGILKVALAPRVRGTPANPDDPNDCSFVNDAVWIRRLKTAIDTYIYREPFKTHALIKRNYRGMPPYTGLGPEPRTQRVNRITQGVVNQIQRMRRLILAEFDEIDSSLFYGRSPYTTIGPHALWGCFPDKTIALTDLYAFYRMLKTHRSVADTKPACEYFHGTSIYYAGDAHTENLFGMFSCLKRNVPELEVKLDECFMTDTRVRTHRNAPARTTGVHMTKIDMLRIFKNLDCKKAPEVYKVERSARASESQVLTSREVTKRTQERIGLRVFATYVAERVRRVKRRLTAWMGEVSPKFKLWKSDGGGGGGGGGGSSSSSSSSSGTGAGAGGSLPGMSWP